MSTPSPYMVNVSSVQDFYQCRFRWVMKWVENRVPRNEGPALAEGKLLHLIFDDYHKGVRTMQEAIDDRCREWISQAREAGTEHSMTVAQKAVTAMKDRAEALVQWKDKYEFEFPVLESEEPFEIEFEDCPGVIFRGRPDRAGVMGGQVWHVQNRGLAASMNFPVYLELAKRHYHEPLPLEEAIETMKREGGHHLDTEVIRALLTSLREGRITAPASAPAHSSAHSPTSRPALVCQ